MRRHTFLGETMSRIKFVVAAVCYKCIQWARGPSDVDRSNLAVFAGDDLGLRIACLGEFESEVLSYLRRSLWPEVKNKVFLDVGANAGNHSLGLADHFAHCHAFEPDPRTYKLLELNTAELDNITTHQIALSNRNDLVEFCHDHVNTGKSHIIDRSDKQASEVASNMTVQTRRLDDLDLASEQIGLIKIDVEGHETQVLEGARSILHRHKPHVMIELLASDIFNNRAASLDFLAGIGYNNFTSLEVRTLRIGFIHDIASLRWINHVLTGLFIIFRGVNAAKAVPLDISALETKNYDAILVSM